MVTITHFHPGKLERDTNWYCLIIFDNLTMTGSYEVVLILTRLSLFYKGAGYCQNYLWLFNVTITLIWYLMYLTWPGPVPRTVPPRWREGCSRACRTRPTRGPRGRSPRPACGRCRQTPGRCSPAGPWWRRTGSCCRRCLGLRERRLPEAVLRFPESEGRMTSLLTTMLACPVNPPVLQLIRGVGLNISF